MYIQKKGTIRIFWPGFLWLTVGFDELALVFFSLFTLLWFSIECLLKGIKYSSQKYLFEHIFQGQKGIRDSEYFEVDKKDYYYEVNA